MTAINENALDRLIQLEKEAKEFGFNWPDAAAIIEQAMDECHEIKEAIEHQESPERIQEEIGDLLHSAISLCFFSGFDIDATIDKVTKKFSRRLDAIKSATKEAGLKDLHDQSFDKMLQLWEQAKIKTD